MNKLLAICLLLLASFYATAQKGFIRGKISDGETGEPLYGATVLKEGTTTGVISDFDGNYSLALDPGNHTIILRFVSFKTQRIENVEVKANTVTTLDFTLQPDISELTEVVVSASATRDSDLGIMTFRRRSPTVVDGLSNQSFRVTGDRDLATAIGRVTGVSVQGGKYVYVRGLGDRYTRTTLNGMTIPGLDPDRNDVQMDIFPTALLENVIVNKTFSPNLPGDFTGGMVDIETRSFPEEKITAFSIGTGFNPDMNLKDTYISYKGGKTDWLGFDDGTRRLPFPASTVIPDVSSGDPVLEQLTRSLQPQLGVQRTNSFLNTNLSFHHGNQLSRNRFTIGYSAIFNYQNRFEYFRDVELGEYTKDDDPSEHSLFREEVRKGELSRSTVLWSGIAGAALKTDKHTISASLFRTQSGTSEASERINRNYDETQAVLFENILTYSQRSVMTGLLSGTHQLGKARLDWRNSLTRARTYDPDFRATSISITDPDEPTLNRGDGAGIRRFWRDLNETNENLRADLSVPYGKTNKIQVGGAMLLKSRDFGVNNYQLDATRRSDVPLDPDYFMFPENIWTAAERTGTYVEGNYEAANNFQAKADVYAAYLMTEMSLTPKLKAIYGVRAEKASMFYTGSDIFGNRFDNMETLDELDILPSANLVFAMTEKLNIRGSASRTLARPSFKEKSTAQIYDPITKRFFNGNLDLTETSINNFDLRVEEFFGNGDMISVSGFYKQFDGHIELVTYDVATNNVKPRNSGESTVYGTEVEVKKRLDFISPVLAQISLGSNLTVARSMVDLNSVYVNDGENRTTEFESRRMNARSDEKVNDTRPMGGQSPYVLNSYVNFTDNEGLTSVNLAYNVQGESLAVIGVGAVPDVYTQPFHSLNLNTSRNFGQEGKHRITFGIVNILNAARRDLYKSYGEGEALYSLFRPGRTFSLTYSFGL